LRSPTLPVRASAQAYLAKVSRRIPLGELPITLDADADTYTWTTTLRLAERFGLTIYDAAYLELAQRRSLPLATLDNELREAAIAIDVTLLGLEA
jgi:predicted nucleic acid-binding protein